MISNGSDFNGTGFLNIEHLKYLYLSPQGRINRQRLWLGGLLLGLAIIPSYLLALWFWSIGTFFIVLASLTFLAAYVFALIASIMLQIKRAHDRNHAGWYMLLTMIPIIGLIFSIELYFFAVLLHCTSSLYFFTVLFHCTSSEGLRDPINTGQTQDDWATPLRPVPFENQEKE